MMPIGSLMIEHRLIERMISLLDNHVKTVTAPMLIDLELIEKGVDFLRSYADRCHHGKEEDILFKALEAKKLTDNEVKIFNELLSEHTVARETVKSLAEARKQALTGNKAAFGKIVQLVGKITLMYPAHIEKEDKHFFLPIMGYFTKEEQANMLKQFSEFDQELIHKKYQEIVTELEDSAVSGINEVKAKGKSAVYVCSVCGYRYDSSLEDSKHGIESGTPFKDLPDDWVCPLCGASKKVFIMDGD